MKRAALGHRLVHSMTARLLLPALMATALAASAGESLPAKVHIEGVPFVSWHDMRDAEFPSSDVVNPSYTAAAEMMFRYWGGDFLAYSRGQGDFQHGLPLLGLKLLSVDDNA